MKILPRDDIVVYFGTNHKRLWKFSGFIWYCAVFLNELPRSTFPCAIIVFTDSTAVFGFHTFIKRLMLWSKSEIGFFNQTENWSKIKSLFMPIESGYSANQPSTTSQLYTLRGVLLLWVDSVTSFMKGFSVTVGASSVFVFACSVLMSVVAGTGPWNSNKVVGSHKLLLLWLIMY